MGEIICKTALSCGCKKRMWIVGKYLRPNVELCKKKLLPLGIDFRKIVWKIFIVRRKYWSKKAS